MAYAGRFEEAGTVATQQYQQALAEHSPEAQAHFAWHLARTVGERGHVRTAARLGLESTFRPHGRPPKKCNNGS